MKILLDTNAIIYAIHNKVDLRTLLQKKYGLPEILVPDLVVREIEKLKLSHKSEDRIAASLALDMIQKKRFFTEITISANYADDALLNYAVLNNAVVVTNDLELRFRLKEKGAKVLCIRQKNHLEDW